LLLLLPILLAALLGAGPADLNEAGRSAYQRGDYTEAERLFSQGLLRTPNDPLLHYPPRRRSHPARTHPRSHHRLRNGPASGPAAGGGGGGAGGLRAIGGLGAPSRPRRPTDETIITLTRVPGGWLTEVVINGAWTGPLLLDTGASVTLVSPAVARAAGVSIGPDTPMVEVQGIAGRTRGHLVTLSSIQVGEIEARGVRAVVAELPPGLHGLLGNSFLARYTFTLDPREGALRLQPR
jgi:clan AA aspartic protease (TIGR02281 family)